MVSSEKQQRAPVGVLPYGSPPLSGLYRMRYTPPTSSLDSSTEKIARQLYEQILRADSLESGAVDLFTLYSLSEAVPVPCSQCSLHMDTTLQTCSYRLKETFTPTSAGEDAIVLQSKVSTTATPSSPSSSSASSSLLEELRRGWYAFFFPLSECGRLKDNVLVYVNGALLPGDVAECDFDQTVMLRPLPQRARKRLNSRSGGNAFSTAPAGAAASATMPFGQAPVASPRHAEVAEGPPPPGSKRGAKPLFYYIVSPISLPTKAAAAQTPTATVSVLWKSYPSSQSAHAAEKKKFTLLYSYYCAPRAPDALTCRAQFRSEAALRLVRSPNCDGAVQLRSQVTQQSATLRVETIDGASLESHRHPKDYTFQITFYFGAYTGLMEETSWFAAFVIAAAFSLLLWFFLTKDLVL